MFFFSQFRKVRKVGKSSKSGMDREKTCNSPKKFIKYAEKNSTREGRYGWMACRSTYITRMQTKKVQIKLNWKQEYLMEKVRDIPDGKQIVVFIDSLSLLNMKKEQTEV